tara:strand:- start:324 stop:926 length:603 start_codon:yes stop_codon:yes gene_type:complete
MILKKASHKAIKYACLKFHYAKSVPVNVFGYSVFNDKKDWCGVILYGTGANKNLGKQYNLQQGKFLELVRVALNGKQSLTSKALALSLKLIKKDIPLVKLIVSYADKDQKHYGTIYQATNWIFTGEVKSNLFYKVNGKIYHSRSMFKKGVSRLEYAKSLDKNAEVVKSKGKLKYIYPLTKELKDKCLELKKPYPKNASKA